MAQPSNHARPFGVIEAAEPKSGGEIAVEGCVINHANHGNARFWLNHPITQGFVTVVITRVPL
jgi:hypothetical protein